VPEESGEEGNLDQGIDINNPVEGPVILDQPWNPTDRGEKGGRTPPSYLPDSLRISCISCTLRDFAMG
jgi:hypothetical protein